MIVCESKNPIKLESKPAKARTDNILNATLVESTTQVFGGMKSLEVEIVAPRFHGEPTSFLHCDMVLSAGIKKLRGSYERSPRVEVQKTLG